VCGHTRFAKIRNEVIRGKIEVASVEDKLRDARLRWFDHIRSMDTPVKRCENFDLYTIEGVEVDQRRVGVKLLDTI